LIVQLLRHLLPIISPSDSSSTFSYIREKVQSNLDFYLPFRRHAPSLANARREIYADSDRLASPTGLFNILAFRGVFFGSPFAQSDRFKWFSGYKEWKSFAVDEEEEATKDGRIEEEYYVKRNCYGRPQKERSTELLEGYWKQRDLWNSVFDLDETTKPTAKVAYYWLMSTDNGVTRFRNIGSLSALLICGDLIEAGLVLMPSPREFGELISKVDKGAKEGMTKTGLVKTGANREELCKAFTSLDLALLQELTENEKELMGYNVVMLEHTLCKISRLMKAFSINFLQTECSN
jgi:hypothetical protein